MGYGLFQPLLLLTELVHLRFHLLHHARRDLHCVRQNEHPAREPRTRFSAARSLSCSASWSFFCVTSQVAREKRRAPRTARAAS